MQQILQNHQIKTIMNPSTSFPHIASHTVQQQISTSDDLQKFKLSELLRNQPSVESMSNQQLMTYCHNEWIEWMKNSLELKQLIDSQEALNKESKNIGARLQDIKNLSSLKDKPNYMNRSSQQGHFYPANFMGSAFQDPVRAQNQNMVFMPNASRVQYSNPPFPFPSYQPENLDRFQNFNGKGA